jgi:predicted DsbA family dithiol-disulfide isomerase
MGTEKRRQGIINWLLIVFEKAKEEDKNIDKKAILAEIQINYGVTEKKAKEYIKLLIDSGKAEEDELGYWPK